MGPLKETGHGNLYRYKPALCHSEYWTQNTYLQPYTVCNLKFTKSC